MIKNYLWYIYEESISRDYHFNAEKIKDKHKNGIITVTSGQLKYELIHLKIKLAKRSVAKLKEIENIKKPLPHPLFKVIKGKIESWEIIK